DPAGNSYLSVANAFAGSPIKINTAGSLVWTAPVPGLWWMGEEWGFCFNSAGTSLNVVGSMGSESIGTIDLATGAMSGVTTFSGCGGCGQQEIRSVTTSPNGNYYS